MVAEDRLIAGSPKQCLEQLKKWQDVIQPDYLMIRMRQLGKPDQPEALDDIRRFGYEVIPYL
jgi:alkanesulfonate monooxygenase SsuD/methylene tetrahydromethanopterin reductase-like flavin-dependent oxidoreductase (luciferase family)